MKKAILFVFVGVLITLNSFAHKEWVHQYMVKQAYYFLQNTRGINPNVFSKLDFGIDYWGSSPTDYYGEGDSNDPWITSTPIAVGAWREDNEDVVFGYSSTNCGHQTNSHFWIADNGDNAFTYLPYYNCLSFNSWQKVRIFLFNGNNYNIIIEHPVGINVPIGLFGWTVHKTIEKWKISYNSIFDLYNDNFTITEYKFKSDPNWYPSIGNKSILGISGHDLALQILGRVAHLLGDMSVPTHVHGIPHPCPLGYGDYYELDMGNSLWASDCSAAPNFSSQLSCTATNWDYNTALQQGGILDDINCMTDQAAMHYLFYSTNQIADFFPSGASLPSPHTLLYTAVSGDNNINTSDPAANTIQSFYSTFGNTTPSTVNTQQIANVSFNYAIRACATLFYWFQTRLEAYQPIAYVQDCNTSNANSITSLAANQNGNVYSTSTETKVYGESDIYAGNNVTTTYPSGDFVVANGTKVTFIAGTNGTIHLTPGFKVENGAEFQTKFVPFPCNKPSARIANYEQFNDSDLIRIVKQSNDSLLAGLSVKLINLKVNVFPNPFNQNTILEIQLPKTTSVQVSLINMLGQIVQQILPLQTINAGSSQYTINRNNLEAGVYLLQVKTDNETIHKQLIIQ